MKKILYLIILSFIFAVDYESQIQPVFDSSCISCHNPSSQGWNNHQLNLTSYAGLMLGGESGSVVVPFDASSSLLWQKISQYAMPPYGSGVEFLNEEQTNLIADWIDGGALPEESNDISGCTDSNAITCDDDIDSTYFPECETCTDGIACDNYYNPDATIDNNLCMYSDVPLYDEFFITQSSTGFDLDWTDFTPPVDILQYVLQRCLDPDGDTDGDGEFEYENCTMLIAPGTFYLETTYSDEIGQDDGYCKYTLYVHYPNNTYWGSAQAFYYYDSPECTAGDVSNDGIINVIDIVSLVNHILGSNTLTEVGLCAADLNSDGIINVIDIVSLVNIILS